MSRGWLACTALTVIALAGSRSVADESPAAPLDLRVSDIRNFVDADELATPLPDELEEIIVNGKRPEPLPEHRALPHSMLGALGYAGTHPLEAWRIFVPDPYFEIPERSEDDTREPPGSYRAKILEPGAIFD